MILDTPKSRVRSIIKIDRATLPPAEKIILIYISLAGNNLNSPIRRSNEQIAADIGESTDYVKNMLMRLKNKGFVEIEGRSPARIIHNKHRNYLELC